MVLEKKDSDLLKRSCDSLTKPVCSKYQKLILTYSENFHCKKYVCQNASSSRKTPLGGIIGGTIGGVALLVIAVGAIYLWIRRLKRKGSGDIEGDIMMDQMEKATDQEQYSISNLESFVGDPNMAPLPGNLKETDRERNLAQGNSKRNSKVSFYESFTKPNAKYKRPGAQRMSQMAQITDSRKIQAGAYGDADSSRLSVSTSNSTTNASNIIPVIYIPGVTVRPTKNNTRSIYSNETQSVFSDMNTIEQASIVGDITKATEEGSYANDTMTAIKAQPRLVNIEMIEEEDENIEQDIDLPTSQSLSYSKSSSRGQSTEHVTNTSASLHHSPQINFMPLDLTIDANDADFISDSNSDSDVDSDIGEINRATSIKRNNAQATTSPEVLNSGASSNGIHALSSDSKLSFQGSVILDAHSDHNSPFRDN